MSGITFAENFGSKADGHALFPVELKSRRWYRVGQFIVRLFFPVDGGMSLEWGIGQKNCEHGANI